MGDFPSGQRGQTVNLLAMPSVVRIHHPPPKSRLQKRSAFYFCAFHYSPPRKPLALPHSSYPSVGADASVRPYEITPCRAAPLITDAGRRGRRPLRISIGKQCVGVGLPDDPFYRTPCNPPVIARPVRTLAVAIRPPSPCTRSREQLFSQYPLLVTSSLSCPLQYHKFLVVSILNLQVSCNYRLTSTRK